MIAFSIPGEPVAKGRAKVSTVNGHVQMRTPTKTVNYEAKVGLIASQAMGAKAPFKGPVSLTIQAVFKIPKSWSKKRLAANFDDPEYVIKRPDLDNIEKAICDGMNGIVFVDDSQVAAIGYSCKVYGDRPRVDVTVSEL